MKYVWIFLVLLLSVGFPYVSYSQDTLPNSRWFIKPHVIAGYNIGSQNLKGIGKDQPGYGFGYGAGIRCLYDFRKIFLGGSVFAGVETSFLSALGFEDFDEGENLRRKNYIVISPFLEQNYKWMHYAFQVGNGIGFYKGVQAQNKNAIGLITNIGWFPIYRGKKITPYITYRNDFVFDRKATNMECISVGINF